MTVKPNPPATSPSAKTPAPRPETPAASTATGRPEAVGPGRVAAAAGNTAGAAKIPAHLQNAHDRTHAPEPRQRAEHVKKAVGAATEKPKLAPHVEAAIRATLEKKG